jgi:hypothetical protein
MCIALIDLSQCTTITRAISESDRGSATLTAAWEMRPQDRRRLSGSIGVPRRDGKTRPSSSQSISAFARSAAWRSECSQRLDARRGKRDCPGRVFGVALSIERRVGDEKRQDDETRTPKEDARHGGRPRPCLAGATTGAALRQGPPTCGSGAPCPEIAQGETRPAYPGLLHQPVVRRVPSRPGRHGPGRRRGPGRKGRSIMLSATVTHHQNCNSGRRRD